jgi:transposase InsO family protein
MGQRAALSEAEKQYLQRQKGAGVCLRQIAEELHCSTETTRKWWRWLRKGTRPKARGRPKRGILSTYPSALRETLVSLKREHPHWGPVSVKLELRQDPAWAGVVLPSDARLSLLFRAACPEAVQPRKQRLTRPHSNKAYVPHQRWQIDTKEGVQVGQDWVSIQEVRDVYCGLMLAAMAFVTTTPKRWRRLSLEEHRQVLRGTFQRWGLPLEVQTDHDGIFVSSSDPQFPSLFTLWLVGLGVQHVTSRPYRPTDQGAIERNHRTLADFSWKDRAFEQVGQLQQSLDHHQQRYNTQYPSNAAHCAGQPPLVAFPHAQASGRPYHPVHEWDAFHLEWVDAYLAALVWTRTVMTNGRVNLGKHYYQLTRKLSGQMVSIRFLSASRSFCFQTMDGTIIKELPVLGLEKQDIIGFLPANLALPVGYQFSLPLVGV